MRVSPLLLLSFGLLTACGTQPTATQVPTSSKASGPPADTVLLLKKASARPARPATAESTIPPPPPDSIFAFMGSRKMKFTYVSDADLRTLLFNNGLADELLLGRFRLVNEQYKQLRLYYQPTPGTGDWIETQLEPLGNGFAADCQITMAAATLGNTNTPAVLVTMEWKMGDRGGETSRRAINLIDIAREPFLVLRSETFVGRLSIDHDTEADPTETSCEQTITLRNGEIAIGAPEEVGDGGCELTLLPAGRYRYQKSKGVAYGKVIAIKE